MTQRAFRTWKGVFTGTLSQQRGRVERVRGETIEKPAEYFRRGNVRELSNTVADAVEAMVSSRPYRSAYAIDTVLDEIEKNKDIL